LFAQLTQNPQRIKDTRGALSYWPVPQISILRPEIPMPTVNQR